MVHGLTPIASAVGYGRGEFELVTAPDGCVVYRGGREHAHFPHGWRLSTDRDGNPLAVAGMSARPVTGTLQVGTTSIELTLRVNEHVRSA